MSGDNSTEGGRKRSRGAEASTRKEALERLKAIREGGRRNLSAASGGGYDIRIEEPIFDTVDDDEYESIVSRRREEARGFVVDDGEDGDLGYGDEGEEEDFTKPSGPDSTDESDDGGGGFSGRLRKKKGEKKKAKEQQPQVKKVNPALKAAATITGEGRLSSMFTSSSFKKGKETDKVKCEGILDEVLAEVTPDDLDRERHRRRKQPSTTVPITFSRNKNLVSVTSSEPKQVSEPTSDRVFMENELMKELKEEVVTESEVTPQGDSEKMELPGSGDAIEDGSKDVRQSEAKAESEVKEVYTLNATVDTKEKDSALSATAGWKEAMGKGGTDGASLSSNSEGQSEFDLDADGSLRFYILDAYEEAFGASMGTIYLFGKVSLLGFFYPFFFCFKG